MHNPRFRPLAFGLGLSLLSTAILANDPPAKSVDRVVITASHTQHDSLDAPATVTIITREELEKRPLQDVLDALRGSSGLSFHGRQVGGRRVLSLRGMESRHVLFLIDGQRITASDDVFGHSDYQYDWLPLDAVERIEVVRGPLSSLYGSEALGGVVNVITRRNADRLSGRMALSSGEGSDGDGRFLRLGAQLALPIGERFSLRLEGSSLQQDAVPNATNPNLSDTEDLDIQQQAATLSWLPNSAHRVDLHALSGEETRWQDTNNYGAPPIYRNFYLLDRSLNSLRYRYDGADVSSEFRHYQTELAQKNRKSLGTATAPQTLTDTITEGRLIWRDLGAHTLTVGAETRTEELQHRAFKDGRDQADQDAAYLQDEWRLADPLSLTLGLRHDRHAFFGAETSPRAYLVWRGSSDWSLKAGVGHGFRAPSLKQSSPNYRFDGPHSFIGNGDLRPETSDSRELGFEFQTEQGHARATLFNNVIDDLIGTVCVENCNKPIRRVNKYVNYEQAVIKGIELEGGHKVGQYLEVSANYGWLDTENKKTGRPLPERPKHTLNLQLALQAGDLGTRLRAEHLGEQQVYLSAGPSIGLATLPSYTLWHLDAQWSLTPKLRLKTGVENLADVDLADKSTLFSFVERGRRFWLGLDAQF